MRNFIILTLVGVIVAFFGSSQATAQSGSRSGGGLYGGFGRPSRAQRQQLKQQQLQQQRLQAQQNALLRAQQAKKQYKQSLVQLGLAKNKSANSKQYKIAFQEAQRDYKALRSKQVAPNQLGVLQSPFRLTNKDISRSNNAARWPNTLRSNSFGPLVQNIDQTIMDGGVSSQETAQDFLKDLQALNVALNNSAIQGNVNANEFARARRFITGLANEVRSSNFVM